jgi:hypothetical protein
MLVKPLCATRRRGPCARATVGHGGSWTGGHPHRGGDNRDAEMMGQLRRMNSARSSKKPGRQVFVEAFHECAKCMFAFASDNFSHAAGIAHMPSWVILNPSILVQIPVHPSGCPWRRRVCVGPWLDWSLWMTPIAVMTPTLGSPGLDAAVHLDVHGEGAS